MALGTLVSRVTGLIRLTLQGAALGTGLLFAHGAATADSTLPGGRMLQALGLGLIPFSAQYLLLRGFYAFENTRTPFWMGGVDLRTDIVLPPRATCCCRCGGR